LDFLDIGRTAHLQYSCAFVGIGFSSSTWDHEAEELASIDPESAFFQVDAYVVFADFSESLFQNCHVLGYAMGFDEHVVDAELNILSDQLFKDLVHQSLVCSACIFQAKGHDPVAEVDIFSVNAIFSSSGACI